MKVTVFLIFTLISLNIFSEEYFCSDGNNFLSVMEREGSKFLYKTKAVESTLEIVYEDSEYLFLIGNFNSYRSFLNEKKSTTGGTVVSINKVTNESTTIFISPDKGESSTIVEQQCLENK